MVRFRSNLLWGLLLMLSGLVPWLVGLGEPGDPAGPFGGWSYDFAFAFQPTARFTNVTIIELDEKSFVELGHKAGALWNRDFHTRLLRRLEAGRARLAVFDVFFSGPGE